MPDRTASLIEDVNSELASLIEQVEIGRISLDDFHDQASTLLAIGHVAAYLIGAGVTVLAAAARIRVQRRLDEQLQYLSGFVSDMTTRLNDADAPWADWRRRLAMYADNLDATASAGRYALWPIPDFPRSGTAECKTNCKCSLRLDVIDLENLDGDVYWQTAPAEHCPTCQQRGATWNPLRIRGGVVQNA